MLVQLDEWLERNFTGERRPSIRTAQNWCERGFVAARKIGRRWFVDTTVEAMATDNPLADEILKQIGEARDATP